MSKRFRLQPRHVSLHHFYIRFDHWIAECELGRTVIVSTRDGHGFACIPVAERKKHKKIFPTKRLLKIRPLGKRWC